RAPWRPARRTRRWSNRRGGPTGSGARTSGRPARRPCSARSSPALRRRPPAASFLVSCPAGPQVVPVLQSAADLGLQPARARPVERAPRHLVGKVVLAGKGFFGVVVVGIALAVAEILHQPGRRIENML